VSEENVAPEENTATEGNAASEEDVAPEESAAPEEPKKTKKKAPGRNRDISYTVYPFYNRFRCRSYRPQHAW